MFFNIFKNSKIAKPLTVQGMPLVPSSVADRSTSRATALKILHSKLSSPCNSYAIVDREEMLCFTRSENKTATITLPSNTDK